MIRLFKVYYPIRKAVLLTVEAMAVYASLLLGTVLWYGANSSVVLEFDYGYYKLLALAVVAVVFCHWLDLYDSAHFDSKGEVHFRLLMVLPVPGVLVLGLVLFPGLTLDNHSLLLGIGIATLSTLAWRSAFPWLAERPYLRERVYVLGEGEQAERLVRGFRTRPDLGVDVVGSSKDLEAVLTRESMASHLLQVAKDRDVHRVIVALDERRSAMPMKELLQLRLEGGVLIEEATSWLEKIDGKIEVEQLKRSWIIFAEGFRFSGSFWLLRQLLSLVVVLLGLPFALILIPIIAVAIKIFSPGPVFYHQERIGRGGKRFCCYKFRTMRPDAEADIGPTWADDDDPRITTLGKYLRLLRLDEIPQLWCVLKGDMAFVGPRPERPEFVEMLTGAFDYYPIRHLVRPGITGYAQIRYKYGNTIEDAKKKLEYDLFYIKNASIGLDVFIMVQTLEFIVYQIIDIVLSDLAKGYTSAVKWFTSDRPA
ncbi:MAG: exopolysaccharide biosynthesis polyprenyl glycosylphosphotransferase [Candidatus Sulfotelmatobacter sp.]